MLLAAGWFEVLGSSVGSGVAGVLISGLPFLVFLKLFGHSDPLSALGVAVRLSFRLSI